MIVETHCHIVAPDQHKYPRHISQGVLGGWVRDLSAEDLLVLMKDAGIDRAVLVQAYGAYGADNSYVADSVARYPDRFAGEFAIDPMQPDASRQMDHWVRERGLHGARLVTLSHAELTLDHPCVLPIWQRAAALQIPLGITTEFRQVPMLPPLLERFAEVSVALEHMGGPRLGAGAPYADVQPLFDLARFPNCYVKFSSVSIYAAMAGRSTPAQFFRRLVDTFGARRLVWGSNFPATYDRGLRQQLELAREQLAFLPADDQRWIFGESVLSLWPSLR